MSVTEGVKNEPALVKAVAREESPVRWPSAATSGGAAYGVTLGVPGKTTAPQKTGTEG